MARTAISPVPRDAAGKPPLAPKPLSLDESRVIWRDAFRRVRAETEKRAAHLSAEDQIVQSMVVRIRIMDAIVPSPAARGNLESPWVGLPDRVVIAA